MKYDVHVVRTGYSHLNVTIEADSEKEAKQKAITEAENTDMSDKDSFYDVESIFKSDE